MKIPVTVINTPHKIVIERNDYAPERIEIRVVEPINLTTAPF